MRLVLLLGLAEPVVGTSEGVAHAGADCVARLGTAASNSGTLAGTAGTRAPAISSGMFWRGIVDFVSKFGLAFMLRAMRFLGRPPSMTVTWTAGRL